MGATGKFNPNEWRTLQFAPFWMLSSLAGVHRNFDPLEVEGFSRSLDNAAKARGRLAREVIASVSENRDWLLEEFERDRRTIAGGLCAVADLVARTPIDEARMFKEMLVGTLGRSIATARGPFGRAPSIEDIQKLRIVAQLLADTPNPSTGHVGAA